MTKISKSKGIHFSKMGNDEFKAFMKSELETAILSMKE
jgi:hypothetical protein